MSESVFRELLGESLRREYAEFDNAPEHRFSLRHRLAMKRIFERYEKNVRGLKGSYMPLQSESMPYYNIKQRMIFALVVIILMTLLAGWFIPFRGITESQIDWLRSRYDFSTMRTTVRYSVDYGSGIQYRSKPTAEYSNFLSDLVDLGIYSDDEVNTIRMKLSPLDTRPQPVIYELRLTALPTSESPLDSYRDFVAYLEKQIEYYNDRAKDPSQALEGDTEFAEIIAENYLPLPKSFLELLEKLYAEDSENADEDRNNQLADLDKDDRKYLCEINEI